MGKAELRSLIRLICVEMGSSMGWFQPGMLLSALLVDNASLACLISLPSQKIVFFCQSVSQSVVALTDDTAFGSLGGLQVKWRSGEECSGHRHYQGVTVEWLSG